MAATLIPVASTPAALGHASASAASWTHAHPHDLVAVIVPNIAARGQWLRASAGVHGVRPVPFGSFARRLLDAYAHPRGTLNRRDRHALVRVLLAEMAAEGRLTTFAPVAELPGFVGAVVNWLQEIQGQDITLEDLLQALEGSPNPRDAQLAELYRRYTWHLQHLGLLDHEGLISTAADLLSRNPAPSGAPSLVLVLGFDQFTRSQTRLLENLGSRLPQVHIYLPHDPARPVGSRALSRVENTRDALLTFAAEANFVPDGPEAQPSLQHVRRHLFEPGSPAREDPEPRAWTAIAAASLEGAARLALGRVKRLLLAGADPEDVAVLAPRMSPYLPALRVLAEEYGVPLCLPQPLSRHPLAQAALNLLQLAPTFPRAQVFDALRSPCLGQGYLTEEQVGLLEGLTRERVVVQGERQWWAALEPMSPEGLEPEDERRAPLRAEVPAETLKVLRQALASLFDAVRLPLSGTVGQFVFRVQQALFGLTSVTAAEGEQPVAEPPLLPLEGLDDDYRQAAAEILEAMRGLMEQADLLRQEGRVISRAEFLLQLQQALEAARHQAPQRAAVSVGSLAGRCPLAVRHLVVLGLSEGSFPAPLPPDPFYGEAERQASPLRLRPRRPEDSSGLWWQVLSAATDSVTLLRPRYDEGGNVWPPSPYWEAVMELVQGLEERVHEPPNLPPCTPATALSRAELLLSLEATGTASSVPELQPALLSAREARTVRAQRAGFASPGKHEGILSAPDIVSDLGVLLGPKRWTASRLNVFGTCPYRYFAERVLGLEAVEEPTWGIDGLIRGSILHELLEALFRRAMELQLTYRPEDEEAWHEALAETAPLVLERAPRRYGFAPGPLWAHERAELERVVAAVIRDQASRDIGGTYLPYKLEVAFGGPASELPPLLLGSGADQLELWGRIDRVDRDASRRLRLIDYKSSAAKVAMADVTEGRAVQTVLYALAASAGWPEDAVAETFYLHLSSQERSGHSTFFTPVSEHETVVQAEAAIMDNVTAARSGRFMVTPKQKSCQYCEFSALCRVNRWARSKAARESE